jgi:hypothetical protein
MSDTKTDPNELRILLTAYFANKPTDELELVKDVVSNILSGRKK